MRIKEKFFEILPFLILINIFIIAMKYLIIDSISLMSLIPIFFLINFLVIIASFIIDFKKIAALFTGIKRSTWLFLLIIFLLALTIRFQAPFTHRVYYDEDIYLNIAQNIVNDGQATLCNRGTPDHCDEGVLNKQPQGLSFFLASFFFFLGINETLASIIMIMVSSLSAIALFFLVYLLVKKEEPSLFSSLILALTPIHILWSPTITGETLFVFFAILAITAILAYLHNKSLPTLLLAASLLAYASQLRPEAPLLLPLSALFFLREKLDKNLLIGFVLLLLLFSPYVFQFKNIAGDTWGATSGEKLSLQYIKPNSLVNSKFFIEDTRYPLLFTILALPGIIYLLIKKEYMKLIILAAWFMLFFSMYALFYAGSFNYGADVRFSLTLYPAISILIGLGLYYIRTLIPIKPIFSSLMLIIAILAVFSTFLPFVTAVHEEAWDARLAHDFAIKEAKNAGNNCYVFTHVPTMFLANDIPALQTWYASNNQVVDDIFKKTDCVLFEEGYWCVNVQQYRDGVCKYIKDNFDLIKVNSATEREKTFTLYKIERK